jgi:branched-chain amino acid transport system substrate-binding protein
MVKIIARAHPAELTNAACGPSRRTALKAGLAALAVPRVLRIIPANAQSKIIKIGFVVPQTGPLAAFGEPIPFLTGQLQKVTNGRVESGGKQYEFQILLKDSQSSGSRAADVAAELILRDKVDLLLSGGAPDTVNATSDQAEINGVPCISTACPWQPWFFGRRGDPQKGFDWTYLFCFGIEDIHAAFIDLWSGAPTNKVVGGLFANDPDGNAWGSVLPPALEKAGFKIVDPGRYQPLANDFTAQISAFKAAGADIVTGTMIPPDFTTFWSQAAQQGFRPKVVTIGKAFLFPAPVAALGDRADGLSCEVAWSPLFPFESGLTGQTGRQLVDEYRKASGRDAPFVLGMFHALFEVAVDVLKRAKAIGDPDAIRQAIAGTNYESILAPVDWRPGRGPVKNVSKTPIVAGQWQRPVAGEPLQLVIKATAGWNNIPKSGTLKLLT